MDLLETKGLTFSCEELGINLKIYFRLPFTAYFLGRINQGCKHEWSKLYLFVKEFGATGWYWKRI